MKTLTDFHLQRFAVFSVCVAGHKADPTWVKVDQLWTMLRTSGGEKVELPMEAIARWAKCGRLPEILKMNGLGPYTRTIPGLTGMAELDLRKCSVEELQAIKGIGAKTARFFLLHTRPGVRYAALDVHILKWMREKHGITAPRATPSDARKYRALEKKFIAMADKFGLTPVALDMAVWEMYAR